MAEVVLYIASSVDGYIARSDGSVDWLAQVRQEGEDYGYQAFFDTVDALLMGSRTYEQLLTLGNWPYPDKPCYVFSRRALKTVDSGIQLMGHDLEQALIEIEDRAAKHAGTPARLWLVGGSQLIRSFMDANLVDEMVLSLIPVMLGEGIPLFLSEQPRQLHLQHGHAYASGLVQLRYCFR